ncbi:MAG: penicillin-binding protein [Oscillospiraceae bacterium]|nr:penicillin-binding protein [Oscillospiraceae bacterium]
MNRVAKRAGAVILLVVLLLAGLTFFVTEYVMQAADWAVFPGSPHVYYAGNMGIGAVTDRDGILLLDMNDQREYSSSEAIRKSTLHWIGDENGNISAPAVPNYSSQMVGFDLVNGLYSYGGAGNVAELTLSASVQKTALEALGSYKGTVAVYNYKTGQLLCAVTTPTYDPLNEPDLENDPEGRYEGVYMNRFTQSAYTPGSIFKIVTLAAALEQIEGVEQMEFVCSGSQVYGVDQITCEDVHGTQSLKDAFCNSCNCAFAQLSGLLGQQALQDYVEKLRVTEPVSFDGITTVAGNYQAPAEPVNLAWSAIGQYTDLVNPCSFLTLMGAIAGGGEGAVPYVVEQVGNGLSGYQAKTQYTQRVMSTEVAQIVQEYMRNNVLSKYGDDNFPGLTVCAKTGTGEMDGDRASNAMFAGFVTDAKYPLAFIVCVEEGGYGRATCVPIASAVLTACKEVLDH